ncbi:uncharacterized protein ACN427_004646 isoform 2-T4 [Glossina fuscipes fuscipes]
MYIKGSLHTEYNYNTVAPQLVHFHIRGRNRTKMNMRTTEIWRSSYCYVIVCTISSSSGVANHWTTDMAITYMFILYCYEHPKSCSFQVSNKIPKEGKSKCTLAGRHVAAGQGKRVPEKQVNELKTKL